MPTKSPRAQSWVSCVPHRLAAANAEKPRTTTARASKCRSRKIENGTSTTIGKAPKVSSSTPLCSGRIRPTTLRKFGTSDELERLVRV